MNDKHEKVRNNSQLNRNHCELAKQAEMMAFLKEIKAELDAGKDVPAVEALDKLAKKYKLRREAA